MTRVAIVHDYLTQRGGAERVVLALHEAFPDAPIHTALYDPAATYAELADADVRPLVLNRSTRLRRSHRLAFPLLAPAFTARRVDADVVICSSSGWAHGVRTSGRKLVYCYTPARWLYQPERYLRTASTPQRLTLRALGPLLRRWDRWRARSADGYAAISTEVADRIRREYGVEATRIPPPVRVDPAGPSTRPTGLDVGVEAGFDLCVSRLLAYKNVDAVVQAWRGAAGTRLVVVGDGPEAARLRGMATENVTFLPEVSEAELRWLYAHCRLLVSASHEDFGLTPLEAGAFGKPSVVLRFGGFLDTIDEDVTGVLFDAPEPQAVRAAVERAGAMSWDPSRIRAHAGRYSTSSFFRELATWTGVPVLPSAGADTTMRPS